MYISEITYNKSFPKPKICLLSKFPELPGIDLQFLVPRMSINQLYRGKKRFSNTVQALESIREDFLIFFGLTFFWNVILESSKTKSYQVKENIIVVYTVWICKAVAFINIAENENITLTMDFQPLKMIKVMHYVCIIIGFYQLDISA